MVSGAGVRLIESVADVENIMVSASAGTPIYVRNVASVKIGDAFRVGALDRDGKEAGRSSDSPLWREHE